MDYISRVEHESDALVSLAYAEFAIREEIGEQLDIAEFAANFATVSDVLARHLKFRNTMGAVAAEQNEIADEFPTFLPDDTFTSESGKRAIVGSARTIAVIEAITIGQIPSTERVAGALGPFCGFGTQWYLDSAGPVVTSVLSSRQQNVTTKTLASPDAVPDASLVIILTDGSSPSLADTLAKFRRARKDHMVCFV